MFSGATYALPLARSGLRWRTFLFVFAGPAANLLSAIFVVKVAPQNGLMAVAISKLFIGASFVVGVANLIPFQRRGQMSDGMQLWILLFSKARTERLITMVTLVADYRQGKQISSLADYPMEKWSADNDGTSQYVVANWLAYHQSSDDQIASQHLEACLSGCSAVDPAFRSRLIVQAAEHQALRRKRLDIAREWLGSLKPREREFEVYRVQALVLQQENDFEAAAATVEQAIDYIESLPEEKTRAVRLLSLKNLKVELDKQIAHKT
jgi:hypothetical protein